MPANDFDLLNVLREAGALKSGHFLLSSGRHSDQYIEKFDLLRNPRATEQACQAIAELFRLSAVDVVVGPTTGGIILAFEVGRQLGCMAAYAERKTDGSPGREIRRGTTFSPGQKVLVVDDILTTGGSVRETLTALKHQPVDIIAVAVLVDRSGGKVSFGATPLVALSTLDVKTWDPCDCDLCAKGIPVIKPGTTNVV
ncbi:MAG: orotate phosphoribosyltransferase [Thermomicrobiales bacterium]